MPDAQIFGLILLGLLVVLAVVLWIAVRRRAWLVENGFRTTGVVLDTQLRGGSEGGGSWWSEVRFVDSDGVERTRWLGGRYEGDVEVVHHPGRWKRAAIVDGTVVDTTRPWIRSAARVFVVGLFGSMLVAGLLLSTGLWSPRVGDPRLGAICAGSGSAQHPAYGEGEGPSGVIAVDVESGDPVDIGLAPDLEWNALRSGWNAELVLCLERTEARFVATCDYQDRSLALFDATYDFTLRTTHTAEILDTGTRSARISRRCPFVATFSDSDPDPKPRYATRISGIEFTLLPHARA